MPYQGWYNIPELAKKYKVYAIDLLGFGWSEKALVEYDATVWKDQVSDFMKEVVKEPAILVGNSLGGFIALLTAAELPQQVLGVALLNSAGQFSNPNAQLKAKDEESAIKKLIINPLKEVFQRIVLGFLFWQAKQPARIESVLKSVWYSFTNERIPLRPNDVQTLLELESFFNKVNLRIDIKGKFHKKR